MLTNNYKLITNSIKNTFFISLFAININSYANGEFNNFGISAGGSYSYAKAVSADGSTVIGYAPNSSNNNNAFRWTQSTGMVNLGTFGGNTSYANAVSADGSVVVGYARNSSNNNRAFRWTQSTGMVNLGTFGGNESVTNALSSDGSVVVGWAKNSSNNSLAFRWSPSNGMQSVADWLTDNGVTTVPNGWKLQSAIGVSADGNTVIGSGSNPDSKTEYWLARVSEVTGGGVILDMVKFNQGLIEAGAQAVKGANSFASLAMFGAHHRPLSKSGLKQDGKCYWVTTDYGKNDSQNSESQLIEMGKCIENKDNNIIYGVGVGYNKANATWALGGGAKYKNHYLLAEIDKTLNNNIGISTLVYHAIFSSKLKRNYYNGATLESAEGDPDGYATALRFRVDFNDKFKIQNYNITPYLAYTWLKTSIEGYTESSGAFPSTYDRNTWSTRDTRIGLSAKTNNDLTISLEGVYRDEGNTSNVSGSVNGLSVFDFNLEG